MPGDNPTLPEKSAQHYVFLGGRSDADPVSKRDRATCVRPFVSTKRRCSNRQAGLAHPYLFGSVKLAHS